ncbi:MAG TPA: peptide chain release factor 3 [Bacteroidota bacterium]|nr:peptide chain release factor 3 [Bacteroidota bacterium]
MASGFQQETERRRTFAIISHPDAGKTTLTEKFLLYGGAVQLAGSVTARKNQRQSTSDWMELERKRGISITSTVLQFEYNGFKINLLDTPGHQDFSEDTYRVLTAVDAVVMVIDAGKGIEKQTRKLFEVCRRREIPIFTFMNKLDRPTRDPLELIDELEHVLGIHAYVMNFPLGTGFDFRGVFDRQGRQVHLFELTAGGAYRAPVHISDLSDPIVSQRLNDEISNKLHEELAILDHAGAAFDDERILQGKLTPVFFGSARNNFGVQLLLDGFLAHAGNPRPRSSGGEVVPLERDAFSGFVFKIQANMDPRHRDRIAFLRVCSGKFERDMVVLHQPTGKKIRLSNASKLFGQSRETLEEAYPGDIVGFVGQQALGIGDTLTTDGTILYDEIPHFPPEVFALLNNPNPAGFKKFREGLDQLLQEGVVQAFRRVRNTDTTPILAAVGPLQFDVVRYRLESEYGAESRLEDTAWKLLRYVDPSVDRSVLTDNLLPTGAVFAEDREGRICILFTGEWGLRYFQEKNSSIPLTEMPVPTSPRNNGARG